MIDIAEKQRRMNGLKQVPVSVAKILLRDGQRVINQARQLADAKGLPGKTARDNVYWKLQWHQGAIASAGPPSSLYSADDDLKKWVMQAYIEANAVEEGAGWIDSVWDRMWTDIAVAIAALPAAVKDAVAQAQSTLTWTSGLLIGGAVVLGGAVVYALYKVLSGPTGQALARGLVRR